jgi:hypothetical protein
MQHSVIVNLVVKGTDERDAIDTVAARMNKWLMETTDADNLEGFGYPIGSLLLWGLVEKKEKDSIAQQPKEFPPLWKTSGFESEAQFQKEIWGGEDCPPHGIKLDADGMKHADGSVCDLDGVV